MEESNIVEFAGRDAISDPLTELLRKGARELLQSAVDFRDDGAAMHEPVSGWHGLFSDEYVLLSSEIERPKGMSAEDFDAFFTQVSRDVVPHWRRWKSA